MEAMHWAHCCSKIDGGAMQRLGKEVAFGNIVTGLCRPRQNCSLNGECCYSMSEGDSVRASNVERAWSEAIYILSSKNLCPQTVSDSSTLGKPDHHPN